MEMCNTFNKVQVTAAVHEKYLVELEDIYKKVTTNNSFNVFVVKLNQFSLFRFLLKTL